jgi:hypothetical protein
MPAKTDPKLSGDQLKHIFDNFLKPKGWLVIEFNRQVSGCSASSFSTLTPDTFSLNLNRRRAWIFIFPTAVIHTQQKNQNDKRHQRQSSYQS